MKFNIKSEIQGKIEKKSMNLEVQDGKKLSK